MIHHRAGVRDVLTASGSAVENGLDLFDGIGGTALPPQTGSWLLPSATPPPTAGLVISEADTYRLAPLPGTSEPTVF